MDDIALFHQTFRERPYPKATRNSKSGPPSFSSSRIWKNLSSSRWTFIRMTRKKCKRVWDKRSSKLYFFVLDTNGAVVEWALAIWEIVRGRKWNKRSLCQNALINQLLQPYTIDANGVRFISNLKLSPRQFELCGGGSSKGLGDLLKWEIAADGSQLTSFKVWG